MWAAWSWFQRRALTQLAKRSLLKGEVLASARITHRSGLLYLPFEP
jgi:hypothetical protein